MCRHSCATPLCLRLHERRDKGPISACLSCGERVTMVIVGGLIRSTVLKPRPLLRACFLKARPLQLSGKGLYNTLNDPQLPPPSGLPSLWSHRSLLRNPSGSGVRRFSGAAGESQSSAGWYSALSDSAPVHLCEHFLVSVQEGSGLPWWLSITVATLSVRSLITLPFAAYQLVIIGKVEALQAEISELAKRLRYEVSIRARERGWTEKQCRFQFQKNLRRLVSQLYIRDNCHPFKASLLVWVQLPLWISLSLALRNLSLDQSALHSGLAAGGALWFPDLTTPDSTWILPVSLGLINLLIVEVSRHGYLMMSPELMMSPNPASFSSFQMFSLQRINPSRFQKIMTNFIRAISVLMIPIAATVPSSMALYWFVSSLVGFSHNLLLRSPTVHKVLRLKTQRSETPYRDLLSAFINKYWK
ncbi:cytochrome c oxidase assembly protein COX18%2C mitochondrial isoform X11 [Xyrichtys novacula]|uniref:Cytochrome c oxidase assembly protein COX18, mitochondrial isoform X11 n=1 Tax=Xyrichtys novacula TaxID=13765 RepID=A0AAV1FDM4_XYRNO|nr:cytochrome c oxidase assembly protein COX18%2C mitochondrial isoform X11 [Xyrichtys novacula]